MTLTRERKFLIVILGLGLAVLVFDRLVLSGGAGVPASASAEVTADRGGTRQIAAESRPTAAGKSQKGATIHADRQVDTSAGEQYIAIRLDAWADNHSNPDTVRDAFTPSGQWVGGDVQGDPDQVLVRKAIEQFKTRYKLMAIMGSGTKGLAIINGRPCPVGTMVDGFRLMELKQVDTVFTAVFEYRDQHVELTLVNSR